MTATEMKTWPLFFFLHSWKVAFGDFATVTPSRCDAGSLCVQAGQVSEEQLMDAALNGHIVLTFMTHN